MHKPDDRHFADDGLWTDLHSVSLRGDDARGDDANELAAAYLPRREWFSLAVITLNLAAAAAFVLGGGAAWLHARLSQLNMPSYGLTPVYLAVVFIAHAALNFPLEFWAGYLEERQFGLAKNGIRAWTFDWLLGVSQHGILFVVGSCLLVMTQVLMPHAWLAASAGMLLVLFLLTSYLAADLLPVGLFQLEPADDMTMQRLRRLLGEHAGLLPPVVIFSTPTQRDFAGGLLGLANRQSLLISRSTIELASDALLRFVLLHELGHRRKHHVLLATLIGWAWIVAGIIVCDFVAPVETRATPVFVAWLALTLSLWLAASEPLMAFVGRRMEYAADRYYLRQGGTLDEMKRALKELSRRNIARTDALPRRRTALHPLPSVSARLHRAAQFERSKGAT